MGVVNLYTEQTRDLSEELKVKIITIADNSALLESKINDWLSTQLKADPTIRLMNLSVSDAATSTECFNHIYQSCYILYTTRKQY